MQSAISISIKCPNLIETSNTMRHANRKKTKSRHGRIEIGLTASSSCYCEMKK